MTLLAASCSTKKAKWANVKYHNTTAHYNVWWNGNESLKEGVAMLNDNVVDDYTQILSVYKQPTSNEAMAVFPQMDRAMEKGVKGIKKHSIYVKGEEHVPYVPECYLLTAYASFYKQDYVTAGSTCRMMVNQYTGSRAADEAAILQARCYTADEMYVEAESALDLLVVALGKGNFTRKLSEKLYLAMAESTLPQEKYKKTVQYIKKALEVTSDRETKARLNFILGQIYQKLDKRSVASKYYEQCLGYHPEYVMEFNARISQASCADIKFGNLDKLERDLNKMLKDAKNKEYHDQIYYAKGEMFMAVQKYDKAIDNYRMSVAVSTANQQQKAKSAIKTGEVYYDYFENYDAAQLYYDTAMQIIKNNYPGYADIKVRYDFLTELAKNTRLIDRNDSLFRVADMSPADREAHIKGLIEKKTREEEEAKERELIAQYTQDVQAQSNTLKGDWYFYNANNVQKGMETFKQRWGMRALDDYWCMSKIGSMGGLSSMYATNDDSQEVADTVDQSSDSIADKPANKGNVNDPKSIAYYEKDLPSTPQQRDSMRLVTADALLNAAYLYYDGIMNVDKAIECYLRLANEYPDYDEIVQAFYMLYKLYDKQGNTPNSNYYRDMVLMGFPDSDYANLIRDENYFKEIAKRDQLLRNEYDDLYTAYRRHRYKDVINQAQVIASEYPDNKMLPKFHYWEAMSYVRINMTDKAVATFEAILASVPSADSIVPPVQQQLALIRRGGVGSPVEPEKVDEEITPEEEAAAQNKPVAALEPEQPEEEPLSAEAQLFRYREGMQHYVIVLVDEKNIRATDLQIKLTDFNLLYYSNSGYRVNPLMFDENHQMLTIHRFKNAKEAMQYLDHLKLDDSPLRKYNALDYTTFVISTQNYTTFYNRKNVEAYLEFFNRYYINKSEEDK